MFCFEHHECLFLLVLSLSVQAEGPLTISKDNMGTGLSVRQSSQKKKGCTCYPLTWHQKAVIWNPRLQFWWLQPQLNLLAWFPIPCLSLCFSCYWPGTTCLYHILEISPTSLSESAEVCLESRMLIKHFFTHWWSFLLLFFFFPLFSLVFRKRDGFKSWCNWCIIWLSQ